MYNTIQPINIVYRKPQDANSTWRKKQAQEESGVDTSPKGESSYTDPRYSNLLSGAERQAENNKSTIDYTKNSVNISQIIEDFKGTVIAIKAPDGVKDEINTYLSLVDKESKKDIPEKEIILSNLKNASKVTDKYISDSLKKPSKVVEGWIDALFMQNVVLKADPGKINEIFQIRFTEKQKAQIEEEEKRQTALIEESETSDENAETNTQTNTQLKAFRKSSEYYIDAPQELKDMFISAKNEKDPIEALKGFDKALSMAVDSSNAPFRAAIHFEKGKIFDNYDFTSKALEEYNNATNTPDDNLKAQAHLKMAKIYDDYVKYEPALDHYHFAIAFSGEANNPNGQANAVRNVANMFADRFDIPNTLIFNELAIDCAEDSGLKAKIKAYGDVAQNYEYIGENNSALKCYAQAVRNAEINESYEEMSENYLKASELMRKLGNNSKADSLLLKSRLCLEKSQQS